MAYLVKYLMLLTICLQSLPALLQPKSPITILELRFAANAKEHGIKTAFLNFLDPQADVFINGKFKNGLEYYSVIKSDTTGLLAWKPAKVYINPEHDFGFATGPFLYFNNRKGSPIAAGTTFSIWQKDDAGCFKVLFDGGVSLPVKSQISLSDMDTIEAVETILPVDSYSQPEHKPVFLLDHARQIHPGAILLRPNHQETKPFEFNFEWSAFRRYTWKDGFDRSGKNYYKYGYLGLKEMSRFQAKNLGYFVEIWALSNQGWILMADVMQY